MLIENDFADIRDWMTVLETNVIQHIGILVYLTSYNKDIPPW